MASCDCLLKYKLLAALYLDSRRFQRILDLGLLQVDYIYSDITYVSAVFLFISKKTSPFIWNKRAFRNVCFNVFSRGSGRFGGIFFRAPLVCKCE